ncbi:MAG: DUF2807 domain-containing protein [Henriciella sp.]|nr:DUF2807 domain-containing protein [Henriciella sp.]
MIRIILAASTAALVLAAPAMAETRNYDVSPFDGLEVSAGINVNFETGGTQSVLVENKTGDFDDIIVEVTGGKLVLKRPRKIGWGKRPRYSVTVSAPRLNSVEASSGAEATGSGLSGEQVRIETSSGADADITEIDAVKVTLHSSSGSDLDASGTCDSVSAHSSSGSGLDAGELVCRLGEADASSGSDLTIYASEGVDADASSGASVNVLGAPTDADIEKSSGGSVRIR